MNKFLTFLCLLLLFGCSNDQPEVDIIVPSDESISIQAYNIQKGIITIKAQQALVDWGDGDTTKVSSPDKLAHINHQYAKIGNYTIKLKSQNLTSLAVGYIEQDSYYDVTLGSCPNLDLLMCYFIKSIDVDKCPKLYAVSVYGYNIPFKTSDCPQVRILDVSLIDYNKGTIDIPFGTRNLNCSNNNLTKLQVNYNMQSINCSGNSIETLDLSTCLKVYNINCSNNKLTTLLIPRRAEKLTTLDCSMNELSKDTLDSIFRRLPNVITGKIKYSGNPGSGNCNFSIAQNKGWSL